mgnify:CR=1 FL=1
MPRLTIDGDSLRAVSRAENGHLLGLNGIVSAIRGNHHWIIVNIDQIDECRKIEFEAEFRYGPSDETPNEQRHYSRVGIWTSVQDSPKMLSQASSGEKDVGTSKNDYQTGTGDDYTVVLDSWRFGRRSEIKFNIKNCDDDTTITLALCAIPYFEKSKNPNPMCELHLTIHPTKIGSMQPGIPTEEKITFQLHNNIRTSTIDDELKLLDEFGAFSLDGNGNSVHPKQLFTSREVVKQIEQSENMNLNLAYIGTDTTENLRSLLRSLKENKSVAKKIDTMYLYYTEGWDDNLNDKFPGIVIDESVTSNLFDLQFIKIPEDGSLPSDAKPVDFTIATYVTPWAMNDEKNKTQYSGLINILLNKEKARLITVDPEDPQKIIRSYYDGNYNLDGMYRDELNLKSSTNASRLHGENMVVECTVWQKKVID